MINRITAIKGRQILDSKGRPTIEADVYVNDRLMGRATASTGTSVGSHEALVLRDNDKNLFGGLSVYKAIDNVKTMLEPELIGMDVSDLAAIDRRMCELDGTENKTRIGGNAIYAVSLAAARAGAAAANMPLYQFINKGQIPEKIFVPSLNMLNGGKYNGLHMTFQEFMVAPYGAASFTDAIRIAVEIFMHMGEKIREFQDGRAALIGNYQGWAAFSDDPYVTLQLIHETVKDLGYQDKVCYALDCANSDNYDKESKKYRYKGDWATREELISDLAAITEDFPILFIEDGLDEDDFEGFAYASSKLNTIIVGDDFLCTNKKRLEKALEMHACRGMIFKPNQVGTVTEALEAVKILQERDLYAIPSGRAGGAVDDPTPEIAFGFSAPVIKTGAPRSGERTNAINTMMRIEEELEGKTVLYDLRHMLEAGKTHV
ncbi:MAG: phosphopyruvate hydratase [Firmicutes bacterium]|nr:phosphopyruvate hydratase [Bacillota bacterium]